MVIAQYPEQYRRINREQALGDAGPRQAKEGYQGDDSVRKYRACGVLAP